MNCEIPDVQAGFRKGRGTRDQIGNIRWIIEGQTRLNDLISLFTFHLHALEKEMATHSSVLA